LDFILDDNFTPILLEANYDAPLPIQTKDQREGNEKLLFSIIDLEILFSENFANVEALLKKPENLPIDKSIETLINVPAGFDYLANLKKKPQQQQKVNPKEEKKSDL